MQVRLFFATDIHGSEKCFLKFLNAARFYDTDVLILGGDITGKLMVPVVRGKDGLYRAMLYDAEQVAAPGRSLEELEKRIRYAGFYPLRCTPDEVLELARDKAEVERVFSRLIRQSVSRWMEMAENRLRGTGVVCLVQPGNDDQPWVGDIISESEVIQNPQGRQVELPGGYVLVSMGYANETPWDCPGDLPEGDLETFISSAIEGITDMGQAIFNFHCPPFGTAIDHAPELDRDLRTVTGPGGGPNLVPVGSLAVRAAIEQHQPLLGLHGHIHESRGSARIGRTLCINPGSAYNEGLLQGVIIGLNGSRILDYQFTVGS